MPERERRRIVDGLAAGLTPARRSRRDQVAFAPLRLARQSVLGSEVQDTHVSPGFPHALCSLEDARAHCVDCFRWYNTEHHHSGLGLHTPSPCITSWLMRPTPRVPTSSPRPTPRVPNALSLVCPPPARCRPPRGSILPNRERQRTSLSKPHPPGVSNSLTGSATAPVTAQRYAPPRAVRGHISS